MRFRLPLEKRLKVAARRKERYWTEPAYRLRRINEQRSRVGLAPLASVDGVTLARPVEHRLRDEQGRFA